jgi:hypothetical protein
MARHSLKTKERGHYLLFMDEQDGSVARDGGIDVDGPCHNT